MALMIDERQKLIDILFEMAQGTNEWDLKTIAVGLLVQLELEAKAPPLAE